MPPPKKKKSWGGLAELGKTVEKQASDAPALKEWDEYKESARPKPEMRAGGMGSEYRRKVADWERRYGDTERREFIRNRKGKDPHSVNARPHDTPSVRLEVFVMHEGKPKKRK